MDDGPLVYYKLTLWAFGSGELIKPAVKNQIWKTEMLLDIRGVIKKHDSFKILNYMQDLDQFYNVYLIQ